MKILAATGLLAGLFGCQPHHTILVQGTGFVTRDPDFVGFSATIKSVGATSDEATAAVSDRTNAVVKGLVTAGLKASDIKIAGFSIQAHCDRVETASGRSMDKCSGFDAENGIRITLHNLDKTGVILGTLAKLGVDEINTPYFANDDVSAVAAEVGSAAVADARHAADSYVHGSGRTLGGIVHIEDVQDIDSYFTMYGSGVRSGVQGANRIVVTGSRIPVEVHSTSVPITIEKVKYQASVYVEFELN